VPALRRDSFGVSGICGLGFRNAEILSTIQLGILPENLGAVRFSVSVGVLKNDDPVTARLARRLAALGDSLRHPDPAEVVDVDVRRVEKRGRTGPRRDFQALRRDEEPGRHRWRFLTWGPRVRGRDGRENETSLMKIHEMRGYDPLERQAAIIKSPDLL